MEKFLRILLCTLAAGGFVLSVLIGATLPESTLHLLLREGGPIETTAAILHFCVAAFVLYLAFVMDYSLAFLSLCAFLFGLREMDMHKALTSDSITKLNFYAEGSVPLHEKIIVLFFIASFAVLAVGFVKRNWQAFRKAVRRQDTAAFGLLLGAAMLPVLKVFDALPRLLRDHFGYHLEGRVDMILLSIEETMEVCLPLIFLTAAFAFYLGWSGLKVTGQVAIRDRAAGS